MQTVDDLAISAADTKLLVNHYETAAPLIERLLSGIPMVWSTLPKGPDGPTTYHGPLSPHTKPKAPVVDVPLKSGPARYPKLSAERILGLVAHGAVEFYSWSPTPENPTRARFARVLIETQSAEGQALFRGIAAVRSVLDGDFGLKGPIVFDGGMGAAVWISFTDAPSYEDVRAFLRVVCERTAERFSNDVTLEPNARGGSRAHLHFSSNAVGRFSILPYSARNGAGYPIALPELSDSPDDWPRSRACLAGELGEWIKSRRTMEWADYKFGDYRKFIAPAAAVTLPTPMPAQKSHGPIILAAIEVLQDGRSHSAEEILTLALAQHLLDSATSHKYVYTSLLEYVTRAKGNGRKPAIVQNPDRTFRLNEPPDDWPEVDEPVAAPVSAETAALIERLASAATGAPEAFEQAVCDAFEALGFAVTHVGGQKAPDGYGEAPLGPLSYTFTIECKSADEGINDPNPIEAATYRDSYGAQYSALVARAFSGETQFASELQTHGVSAWTGDDLQMLLRVGANPFELRQLFAPGFANDALDDLLWERHHGRAKRVRSICESILRAGWLNQSGYRGAPTEAPHLTEDAAMMLVNQDLIAQGSGARCSREDVRAAIDYLANPLIAAIVRDPADGSIVILADGASVGK